mmetsp:Transcript_55694/g.107460  ORF Transcript_55694/g.107460 Transcript_55694/m.107460 type:complete len:359 (+) Transcript_55694:38-1114(+)
MVSKVTPSVGMFLSLSATLAWAALPMTRGSIEASGLVQIHVSPLMSTSSIQNDVHSEDAFSMLQAESDDGIKGVKQENNARSKDFLFREASRAQMASCRAHAPKVNHPNRKPKAGSVLYVIKTYAGAYENKLRAVMETWGAQVPRSSLLIVGDEEHKEFPIHVANECGSDPNLGLACRVAHGVELAANTPGNWSWVFVVDDDHYVKTDNLERFLATLDSNVPTGVGCYGCGAGGGFNYCRGKGGFCGGCGYGFSRAAVMKAVKGHEAEFRAQHLSVAESKELSEAREDMAISCTMTDRVPDMKVQPLVGGGIDGNNAAELMKALSRDGCNTQSSLWHWIKPEMMHKVHKLVTTDGPGC